MVRTMDGGSRRAKEMMSKLGYPVPQKRAKGGSVRKPSTTVNVIVAPNSGPAAAEATRASMQRGMHASPIGGGAAAIGTPAMSAAPPSLPMPGINGAPLGLAPKPTGMPPGVPLRRGGKVPKGK